MNILLFGIFPPDLPYVLLPMLVFAIISTLLCLAYRFFSLLAIPAFLAWCVYEIKELEFFTGLWSTYMFIVYGAMLLCFGVILAASFWSWKKHLLRTKLS